ncbi:MAG TPA: cytochrome c maturation protein CcmE, partial [Leptospiraceae bacterium]|nr:cytochrome c maturation protein CcmE [Leptospiraceae bacterium]
LLAIRCAPFFLAIMKTRFWVLMILIIGSLAAMVIFTGGSKNTSVMLADASHVVDQPSKYQEHELRVRGFVKPGTILRYGDKADFVMTLDGRDLKVHFDGGTQLPDTFTDAAPVRADGRLAPDTAGLLVANKVEAKCASKYEADYAKKGDFTSARFQRMAADEKVPGGDHPK